jgi:hypothetical protein
VGEDDVTRLATPRTALILGGLAMLALVAAAVLSVPAHDFTRGTVSSFLVLFLSFGGVGYVIARRQPQNPVGWALFAFAFFLVINGVGGAYAVLRYRLGHHGLPLGPLGPLLELSWAPALMLLPLAIVLFPDGRLQSRRWRIVVSAYLGISAAYVGSLVVAAAIALSGKVRITSGGELLAISRPSGATAWLAPTQNALILVAAVFWLAFVGRQVVVWRRSHGVRRQQLKWLMSGAALCMVSGALIGIGAAVDPHPGAAATWIVNIASWALMALPLSIGVGILRYRLYDIDRLISRTLSYALLTGLLVGVFAGLVLLTTRVLPFSSPVGVAASTLAAAGLFNPLRTRLQRLVERRFNRARYDAEATVAAFGARLRDAIDVDTVLDELAAAAGRSLQPAHITVWTRP